MKEHPILFSGAMVRALLDGSKTQTRRIVKNQPPEDVAPIRVSHYHPAVIDRRGNEEPGAEIFGAYSDGGEWDSKSPYGEPGDRLWVREAHRPVAAGEVKSGYGEVRYGVAYQADGHVEWNSTITKIHDLSGQPDSGPMQFRPPPWKPSIHMARRYSRITLEVTGVRVERLQDISEADARAEGALHGRLLPMGLDWPGLECDDACMRSRFAVLWHDINAARGWGWDINPWVWVVEFKRIES